MKSCCWPLGRRVTLCACQILSKRVADISKKGIVARGQRAEVGGQRPEVRVQRSEARGQRPEVRVQRSEARGQRAEGRGAILAKNESARVTASGLGPLFEEPAYVSGRSHGNNQELQRSGYLASR